jgi:predicted AAA+ superfamily ATPase
MRITDRLGTTLAECIVGGGYPAALARRTPARRRAWYRDLVETQIQRDVRDVARIHSLDALPRLLTLTASHTARLVNVSDLAAAFQLTRQTIHDYVTVLERIFLVDRLPAWHSNRPSRLVKAAKLHMGDTGLACALLGLDIIALQKDRERLGPLLETFVLQELRRQTSWHPDPIDFFHYRDRDDFEVDIVLERSSASVAGVEVKAAASVTDADFRGLRKLRDVAGKRFAAGVVLYDGTSTTRFGDDLFAVPLRILSGDP